MGVNVWLKGQMAGSEHNKSLPLLSSTTTPGKAAGPLCPSSLHSLKTCEQHLQSSRVDPKW